MEQDGIKNQKVIRQKWQSIALFTLTVAAIMMLVACGVLNLGFAVGQCLALGGIAKIWQFATSGHTAETRWSTGVWMAVTAFFTTLIMLGVGLSGATALAAAITVGITALTAGFIAFCGQLLLVLGCLYIFLSIARKNAK